ncbi:hypothetical protein [Flavobacterium filum]|uniref:hypothetical protein n=1 Tax=Flavobacterium filum TaxID=370974 RepID=UPI0023F570FE|nr:hypothetical protein [Flavobacterium filum]
MIYFLIFIINTILLLTISNDKRFWFVTITIWTVLTVSFISWKIHNDKEISRLDKAYWKSADENKLKDPNSWRGDETIWKSLENSRQHVKKYNSIFIYSLLVQTFLTFVAQIIGYRLTSFKKTYKRTSIAFGILLIIGIWLTVMITIVPTGPLV